MSTPISVIMYPAYYSMLASIMMAAFSKMAVRTLALVAD